MSHTVRALLSHSVSFVWQSAGPGDGPTVVGEVVGYKLGTFVGDCEVGAGVGAQEGAPVASVGAGVVGV